MLAIVSMPLQQVIDQSVLLERVIRRILDVGQKVLESLYISRWIEPAGMLDTAYLEEDVEDEGAFHVGASVLNRVHCVWCPRIR